MSVASRAGAGIVAVAIAAAACSSSLNDPTPIAPADFPARALAITCTANVACGLYPDMPTCEASTMLNTSQLLADIEKGTVTYDSAAAASCLYGITTTLSPDCRLSDQTRAQPLACARVFIGTVAVGGACLTGNECASQECDRTGCSTACCTGTCTASVMADPGSVPAGAMCAFRSDCVDGTFCDVSQKPALCTTTKGVGQPCQLTEECAAGTACILTSGPAGATVCAIPPGEGEACGGTSSCDLQRDFCAPATMTCVPRIAVGGTCVTGGDDCVLYAGCDVASKKCVARGRANDPCSETSLACVSGLSCIAGECALPAAAPVCPSP